MVIEKCARVENNAELCNVAVVVLHTVQVGRPRICPPCFRVLQDQIFNRYNPAVHNLEEEIEEAQEAFEKEAEGIPRLSIYAQIASMDHRLGVLKNARDTQSAALREKYGVWRDG